MKIFALTTTLLTLFCCIAHALTLEEKIAAARKIAEADARGTPLTQTERDALLAPKNSADAEGESVRNAPLPAPRQPQHETSKTKSAAHYVVDTERDFINGKFVGRVGQTESEKREMLETLQAADIAAKDAQELNFAQTKFFLITSKNRDAVSAVKNAAAAVEAALAELLPTETYTAQAEIKNNINIFDESQTERNINVSTSATTATIDLRWNKTLDLGDVCQTLAETVVLRNVAERVKSGGQTPQNRESRKIPFWLSRALRLASLEKIQLGIPSHSARLASQTPPESAGAIFDYTAEQPPQIDFATRRAHAYWLVKAVIKMSDRNAFGKFAETAIAQNLTGAETFAELQKLLALPADKDTDMILGCVMISEIYARKGGVDTPRDSLNELVRLANVRIFENGIPRTVACDTLISANPQNTDAVKTRLTELKLLLAKINPIFFNAAVALGNVYEAYIKGDTEGYRQTLETFFAEFERARKTAKTVETALQKYSKKHNAASDK